jgi:hypothetical protein
MAGNILRYRQWIAALQKWVSDSQTQAGTRGSGKGENPEDQSRSILVQCRKSGKKPSPFF